ncbi:MAG: hypothetical protein OHK0013_20170 [Sandaracinaceae bacterium]
MTRAARPRPIRNDDTETRTFVLQACVGMEYWVDRCDTTLSWGICRGRWTAVVPAGGAAIVLLETSGPYELEARTF